jgi:hypothetical protein
MSGIYQKQVNSGSVAAPSAGRTLISINESGELFTKDSSGNITLYSSGSGSPFPFTGSADISGTLNIDFTDTLSYVTDENYESEYGFEFLSTLNDYVDLDVSGSFIGNRMVNSEGDIVTFGNIDGTAELVGTGLSFPVQGTGILMGFGSGDYTGSYIRHSSITTDQTGIGGNYGRSISLIGSFVDSVSGDKTLMGYNLGVGDSSYYNVAEKRNNAGELIRLEINESQEGFRIDNDLSDNTASVLRIEDNNGDAILEFFNDYLVSETIPAIDYADDAAAALGGVPVGGIYHNSGTIRIRLI